MHHYSCVIGHIRKSGPFAMSLPPLQDLKLISFFLTLETNESSTQLFGLCAALTSVSGGKMFGSHLFMSLFPPRSSFLKSSLFWQICCPQAYNFKYFSQLFQSLSYINQSSTARNLSTFKWLLNTYEMSLSLVNKIGYNIIII